MLRSKHGFFWPLRLIAAFSLIAPAIILAHAGWQAHVAINAQANERIEHGLDVLQEHALKALQTVERSISEVNEVLRGLSDQDIRAREADIYLRLKRTQQALPQIESIWAFDSEGRPLVSSAVFPVPRTLSSAQRGYFLAQMANDHGTYVGEVTRAPAPLGLRRFFMVSGRRLGPQVGRFDGVIGATVTPEHFLEFYRKLSRGRDAFALVRAEGSVLARFPELRTIDGSELAAAVQIDPRAGRFTAVSPLDGIERRVGYRKVPDFPVYVQAAVETAALREAFRRAVLTELALGLPVALALFALALYALRRAQRFHEEVARREAAETALKQAQRLEAIGLLTGGVAHDFNNLLTVVSGNAERLRRLMPPEEAPRRALEAIDNAVKRGTSLTRQLLSFARRQTHEARTVDLGARLPLVREMLQSGLRGDIPVAIRVAADVWPIKVDVSELELALLNLAVNARDAMPGGGRLELAARNVSLARPNRLDLDGDFVTISVRDTGSGIPPGVLDRVFEPFFTTKEVGRGTGLGLSQVYGFTRQAGGTVTIDSAPGRGTTVTLYLPRSLEPVEPEPGAGESAVPAGTPEQGRILLVEDNPAVAEVMRALLEEFGYPVVSVADAESARVLLAAGRERIDLVLTDLIMPGETSGLDLARWLRDGRGPRIPVVIVTGYSTDAQTAAAEGFAVMRKPFETAELQRAIAEALGRPAPAGAE